MSALSLANLGMGSYTTGEPQVTKTGLNSVEAFQDAMSRSTSGRHDVTVDAPAATRDASAPQAVKPGDVQQGPAVDAASRERVRRSLGLEGGIAGRQCRRRDPRRDPEAPVRVRRAPDSS